MPSAGDGGSPPIGGDPSPTHVIALFRVFLWLGLTSFGGPVAHISHFRREFVERRRWFTEEEFAGWVGLCQFLPGPASSQLGFCLGMVRGGVRGAIAAFLGFTLPSALLLVAGVLPLWHGLTRASATARMMAGVNAGVVGLLAAALYHPVWTGAVRSWTDAVIAVAGFAALMTGRVPVLMVVVGCVVAGASVH